MGVRDTAEHVWIDDLSGSSFVESPDAPSSLALSDGRKLRRLRLYGLVVATGELVVDDGTGSLFIRSFDSFDGLAVGTPVLVIGRPRMFEGKVYVLGELVKPVDAKWLNFARNRWPRSIRVDPVSVVRDLDSGDGADYDAVVARLGSNGENQVVHLLAVGELFETKPGKLKVLE